MNEADAERQASRILFGTSEEPEGYGYPVPGTEDCNYILPGFQRQGGQHITYTRLVADLMVGDRADNGDLVVNPGTASVAHGTDDSARTEPQP